MLVGHEPPIAGDIAYNLLHTTKEEDSL
jgi:hypothetical protein